jgi:Holliday junction resolvase RusA-like endonuclease
MTIILQGEPRTKKNSGQIIMAGGKPRLLPSKPYKEYRECCLWRIPGWQKTRINYPVNVQCEYYMGTVRKVDMVNLMEATLDILVDAGVLADDNSRIVVSHDGSRVMLDRENPRAVITITKAGEAH